MTKFAYLAAPLALLCAPAAAQQLPEAARTMIDTAIASGNGRQVEAVMATARTAFPDDVEEIDAIWAAFQEDQAKVAAARAARKAAEIRQAPQPFDDCVQLIRRRVYRHHDVIHTLLGK